MELTFHGHACVSLSLSDAGGSLVIDPGTFSDTASALAGATAVLITHDHFDHVDVPVVVEFLRSNLDAQVWASAPAAHALLDDGAPADQVHEAKPGQVLDIEDARVTVGGGDHAVIHPEIQRAVNVTYLVEIEGASVYHPGDSYDAPAELPEDGLDVLLVPVSAPWMKMREAIDFARSVSASVVVPIHDVFLSEPGHTLTARWLDTARLGGHYTYTRLPVGDSLVV
ncbi:L-ascorbate metabolism protein UlaG (beta-lactamase superfamily) [Promicromonospora sp. AC04]|uniref:MBL fold metallo-hydrolase n=1 Tax=Promicromonospora sp. AC04 TaxID=2135723 RepID=UPI000D38EAF3|nr:MBL fold metallo-hydrolase [Promicromonospora sp. AC04]PUB26129.1 L-ascorbate metabolism protein UlaG (beta-lactamase superfamily) [Promicromonospora sp. AC04]